ncbi:putative FBD-associated F-box protein [Raphanus sativus]|nr:putative FBD-associated F-box protein [Raphanus sativus]
MDRISQLPDELLLRILSLMPLQDVADTMLLSKRWQFLWLMVPALTFDYFDYKLFDEELSNKEFSLYVERYLFLHEAPAIDALRFKLCESWASGDIQVWLKAAEKRSLRELVIKICASTRTESPVVELPRSLSRCFKTLVTLELRNTVLVDDVASPVFFPSLKKLSLESMKYPGDAFVAKLLSSCPDLEDLVVELCPSDNVSIFSVSLLNLKSLVLETSGDISEGEAHGFVIDAPSLEYLKIDDNWDGFCVLENNINKIVKASISTVRPYTEQLICYLSSAKRLDLCFEVSKICTCETEWLSLLMHMLNNSPNLRYLKLHMRCIKSELRPSWSEASSVPECLLNSLETLEWDDYEGKKEDKEVVAFILKNGFCLEKVIIKPIPTSRKKRKMLKELTFFTRSSPTCRIVYD